MPSAPKFEIDRWVSDTRPRKNDPRFLITQVPVDLTQAKSLCVEYNGYLQTFREFGNVVDVYFEYIGDVLSEFVLEFSHPMYKSYQERFNIELLQSLYYWTTDDAQVFLYNKDGE